MSVILILIIVIIAVSAIAMMTIWGLGVKIKSQAKEIKDYKTIMINQQNNLVQLQDYHRGAKEIKENHKHIINEIKEAKSDEEAMFSIANIINANNKRVPNYNKNS